MEETELKKIWGDDLGAAKLPTYTVAGKQVQMASFTGYKLMGVSAYSANPQWAAKLADWMTNEQNQTVRFEMNGQDLPIQRQRIRMRLRLPIHSGSDCTVGIRKTAACRKQLLGCKQGIREYDGSRKSKPRKVTGTDG